MNPSAPYGLYGMSRGYLGSLLCRAHVKAEEGVLEFEGDP